MTRDQALRKVLACLRLAGSSNPNEAAAALRQARALMDRYGLSEADALASEIRGADAPTRCQGARLTQSLCTLANLVARGYRCDIVVHRLQAFDRNFNISGKTIIRFYGANADATVAAYAFTVLRRQLEADKARHTRRIRKRANKARRGEAFALGWVVAVRQLFPPAELPDGRSEAIKLAMQQGSGETEMSDSRDLAGRRRAHSADRMAGFIAGTGAQLNNGLSENGQRRLEQANG